MTEAEWLACADPDQMLDWLTDGWGAQSDGGVRHLPGCSSRAASERKLRLFTCAAVRFMWAGLPPTAVQETLTQGEQAEAAEGFPEDWLSIMNSMVRAAEGQERPRYAHFLRDIFGNPFKRKFWAESWEQKANGHVIVDPAWVRWQDGTVATIAQAIDEGGKFEEMPILADALDDAGCDNEDLLRHCRAEGPHVRGCWALDLLLGKE